MPIRTETIQTGAIRHYSRGARLSDGSAVSVNPNAELVLDLSARWVIDGGARVTLYAIRGDVTNHGCIVANGTLVFGMRGSAEFHNTGEFKAVGSDARILVYGMDQYSTPSIVRNDGQITANAGSIHLDRVTGGGMITVVAGGRVDLDGAMDGGTIKLHSGMLEFGRGAGMQFAGYVRGLTKASQIAIDDAWDGRDLAVAYRGLGQDAGGLIVTRGAEEILRVTLLGDYRQSDFHVTNYGTDVVVTVRQELTGAPHHAEIA